ncbi:MAG TPA: stage II sporulation protein M, partial [Verrucomicrobiae bacterium]|nr:stage II sporulation protein M [Verrucomicrobiae bacterium]
VSVLTLSLGMTYGVGTIISLFYNGIILGAVSWDYIMDGQTAFLLGWLLPHGVIEIPAILIAGQAGMLLASALIGWGRRATVRQRLREISNDLLTLIGGVALLLVWAGIVEAFLSQRHEPEIPYIIKILFGVVELVMLCVFLSRSGRARETK